MPALLSRHHSLPRGPRVCLRLPRRWDREGIRQLLESHGFGSGDLDPARLVAFDPRRRLVLCASALVDGSERVVGVGAIELGPGSSAEPSLVVVDAELTDGLGPLLADALRAQAAVRRAA